MSQPSLVNCLSSCKTLSLTRDTDLPTEFTKSSHQGVDIICGGEATMWIQRIETDEYTFTLYHHAGGLCEWRTRGQTCSKEFVNPAVQEAGVENYFGAT